MPLEVHATTDAAEALDAALPLLSASPLHNNVPLTFLDERVQRPEPGHYWWATDASGPVGFVMQSPLVNRAWLAPAPRDVLAALVERIGDDAPDLPGVSGEVDSAAMFAGHWAERWRSAAAPTEGGRLYRLGPLRQPPPVAGTLRRAEPGDRDLLVDWMQRFRQESGEGPAGVEAMVDQRLGEGWLWIWDDGGPVSMAMATAPACGVTRVGLVYTPDDRRRHGYAAACVGALSAHALATGADDCILYTQLHNPTSNAIYRRLGYEPIAEVVVYRFDSRGGTMAP